MIHQFRDKKEIAERRKNIRNLIIFGVFVLVATFGGLIWSGKIFHFVGLPIWKTEKILNRVVDDNSYIIRTKKSVFSENENLVNENNNLKMSLIDYKILKDENNKLKELLGRIPGENKFILGNILSKPNHSPYDTIIIDIGSNDNIKEGDKVYAEGVIPLGLISRTFADTALISLYSSPNQKTEAMIEGTNASVELIGRGGSNFEMMIPIDLDIEKGMTAVLPGNQLEIVAYVEEIISSPTDPIKKILLSSPVNIQNLKWVEVKKNESN